MKHESNKSQEVVVKSEVFDFEEFMSKEYIPEAYYEDIRNADVIFYPDEEFRGIQHNIFPENTMSFYRYMKSNGQRYDLTTEISVDDNEYNELELHSDIVNLANIIVDSGAFNIVCGLISAYLFELLRKYGRKQLKARTNITVNKTPIATTISYEGDIEGFERAMKSINETLE